MDAIPRNPSYSASFSPIIFLLHNPFLISLYLELNMYISKDDDYVPTFESRWIHRGWTTGLSLLGRESIPGVPTASQEEALSTGKARGTPGSCHNSKSPPDVSVPPRSHSSLLLSTSEGRWLFLAKGEEWWQQEMVLEHSCWRAYAPLLFLSAF